MDNFDKRQKRPERMKGPRPATQEKYRQAVYLYESTRMSLNEICRICGVTLSGLRGYIDRYYRHLVLARYDVSCTEEEACHIKMGQLRGPLPGTRTKYKEAVEACGNMGYIRFNISEIARQFGVDGSGLSRQLRTHFPGVLEIRDHVRMKMGFGDNLSRGVRKCCKEQYAEAVRMLESDSYVTVQQAAEVCGVSYSGLNQHLLFYHKDLVVKRIGIREKATRRQRKNQITGRGTVHAPSPASEKKYAEAVRLYRTTPMSAARIAAVTNVPKRGFYEYLQRWYLDLICRRKNIPYEEGKPVDWSKVRKYSLATKAKYAEAICKLKECDRPIAAVAAEFGLHPETFRSYLKEHEPELYARKGMVRTAGGGMMAQHSLEKYREAMHLYGTSTDSLKSIARRSGVNDCSLRDFIKRHYPELMEQRRQLLERKGDASE